MFAPRRSVFFLSRRRRARSEIAATVGLAAASAAVAAAAVYFLDPSSASSDAQSLSDRVARASREGYNLAAKIGRGTYKRRQACTVNRSGICIPSPSAQRFN